jgi:hypothetical protein
MVSSPKLATTGDTRMRRLSLVVATYKRHARKQPTQPSALGDVDPVAALPGRKLQAALARIGEIDGIWAYTPEHLSEQQQAAYDRGDCVFSPNVRVRHPATRRNRMCEAHYTDFTTWRKTQEKRYARLKAGTSLTMPEAFSEYRPIPVARNGALIRQSDVAAIQTAFKSLSGAATDYRTKKAKAAATMNAQAISAALKAADALALAADTARGAWDRAPK